MEFLHWIGTYESVLSNLYGQDREDAVSVIDNDAKFDKWMVDFDKKRKVEAAQMANQGKKGGSVGMNMDKEEYLKNHGKVYGGDNG